MNITASNDKKIEKENKQEKGEMIINDNEGKGFMMSADEIPLTSNYVSGEGSIHIDTSFDITLQTFGHTNKECRSYLDLDSQKNYNYWTPLADKEEEPVVFLVNSGATCHITNEISRLSNTNMTVPES